MRPIDTTAPLGDISGRHRRCDGHTYTPPMEKRAISPTLLLPTSRNMPKNGRGKSNTTKSRNMLVAA